MEKRIKEEYVRDWESSGESLLSYSKSHSIAESTFRGWVKKYGINKSVSVPVLKKSKSVNWSEIPMSETVSVSQSKTLFEIKFKIWKLRFQMRLSI